MTLSVHHGAAPYGAPPTRLLTLAQAAALLGLSRRSVYNLIEAGALERVKLGRAARVRATDVEHLVEKGVTTMAGLPGPKGRSAREDEGSGTPHTGPSPRLRGGTPDHASG